MEKFLLSNLTMKLSQNRTWLVFANNIQPAFSEKLLNQSRKLKRYFYAQRAYFENVEFEKKGFIEIYFIKDLLPGYFWIFPSGDNGANVGFGSLPSVFKKRSAKEFSDYLINKHPLFKKRFENATQTDPWKGMKIPFTKNFEQLSGDNFHQCWRCSLFGKPYNRRRNWTSYV
jgi:flavin-dependent dehydrogenase